MELLKNLLTVGGYFETTIKRHRLLSKALEEGDPEKIKWVQRTIRALGLQRSQYDTILVSQDANLVTNEGLNAMLDAWLSGGTQITAYYVSLFESNSTPASTWIASTYRSTHVTEYTDYSESTRPAWADDGPSGQSVANTTTPAEFTATNVASKNIYGAALISASNKSGTGDSTAKLVAATRYSTARQIQNTDVATVKYTVSATST
jgi:hypothetical protein